VRGRSPSIDDLKEQLDRRNRELHEAQEQQKATSEVLGVISRSKFELQSILQSVVDTAARLCRAEKAVIFRLERGLYHFAAGCGLEPAYLAIERATVISPGPGTLVGRAAESRQVVRIDDVMIDPLYEKKSDAIVGGFHSAIGVPLMRENEPIGVLGLSRARVEPFGDREIELVTTFADQAVIAIENVRLFEAEQQRTRELAESLEQQTATSEVLQVISGYPGDLQPVFETMLENGVRICDAKFGGIYRIEGGTLRLVATHADVPAAYAGARRFAPFRPSPKHYFGRMMAARTVLHIADTAAEQGYVERRPEYVAAVELGGVRTFMAVPMLKENEPIGAFLLARQEVRPFTDKQIALVTNFASQAVIAIENTRLLSELRQRTNDLTESLEQQTATSDVLQVISSSPGELEPVFETMLENAVRISSAKFGNLFLREGDFFHIGATTRSAPAAYVDYLRRERLFRASDPRVGLGRLLRTKQTYQVADLTVASTHGDKLRVATIELAAARTLIGVPMIKEGEVIGAIAIYRQEVRPFTDKQIALVQNFAAQAVIAIENTRLLTELRESLQQQTATADVLRVISNSPTNIQPVLDAIVQTAGKLCASEYAIFFRLQDGKYHVAASNNTAAEYVKYLSEHPISIDRGSLVGRTALERRSVHIPDCLADPEYTGHEYARVGKHRSMLGVPLLRDGAPIGVIGLLRTSVRPYTEKQIELVTTFADQAVIAIENTRLFEAEQQRTRELSESLEQQTATSEVLQVISSSPGDLEPVFSTMLAKAVSICDAKFGDIYRWEDNALRLFATHNSPPAFAKDRKRNSPYRPGPTGPFGRLIATKSVIHVDDLAADESYVEQTSPGVIAGVELGGIRTTLAVPMLKENELIGAFILNRQEVRPFNDKQIALVTSFANQAVIAIENARLLTELRQRTEELAQRQAELSVTFDNMGDGVVMFNDEMRLAAWNRNLQEILDVPDSFFAEPRTYRDYMTYLIEHGEFGAVDLETELRRYIESADRQRRIERTRPDGRVLEVRVNPVPGGGFVAIYSDVTERKKAEERVRAAKDAAESALRELKAAQDRLVQTEKLASLGQLTAGIAHEIKNPLNFVNNFSALSVELIDELREELGSIHLDDKRRTEINEIADTLQSNLDKVVQHGKRADSIVKNMLLHSRQGSGEHRPVDINALVDESLNLAYHGARAEKQGFNITLERSFDPAAGEVDLFPQEITRVLLNLISNGFYAATKRKAEADGGDHEPTLAAATKNLGDSVEIRIRDNGTGIPPEVREKLFNPFFTTKPAGEGTGLGLSISHDIIAKQHGGSIEVDTQPGAFTEFRVILPRAGASLIKSGERM